MDEQSPGLNWNHLSFYNAYRQLVEKKSHRFIGQFNTRNYRVFPAVSWTCTSVWCTFVRSYKLKSLQVSLTLPVTCRLGKHCVSADNSQRVVNCFGNKSAKSNCKSVLMLIFISKLLLLLCLLLCISLSVWTDSEGHFVGIFESTEFLQLGVQLSSVSFSRGFAIFSRIVCQTTDE